jgi:hypothetical protein
VAAPGAGYRKPEADPGAVGSLGRSRSIAPRSPRECLAQAAGAAPQRGLCPGASRPRPRSPRARASRGAANARRALCPQSHDGRLRHYSGKRLAMRQDGAVASRPWRNGTADRQPRLDGEESTMSPITASPNLTNYGIRERLIFAMLPGAARGGFDRALTPLVSGRSTLLLRLLHASFSRSRATARRRGNQAPAIRRFGDVPVAGGRWRATSL